METSASTGRAAIFAITAMAPASIGIYGAVAYTAVRRTNELGIRPALGANPAAIARLVTRQRMYPVGLVCGVGAALVAGSWLRGLLFGVSPRDPLTTGVAGLLALVAALACYVPVRRAARIDPAVALKYEWPRTCMPAGTTRTFRRQLSSNQ